MTAGQERAARSFVKRSKPVQAMLDEVSKANVGGLRYKVFEAILRAYAAGMARRG